MLNDKEKNTILKNFPHHGEYTLIRPVGSGGFGSVWEAEHRILHRPVALKILTVLPPELNAEQFVNEEGRGMARLNTASHPGSAHIVHLNRLIPARPPFPPVLEMEWLAGGDLAAYIRCTGPMNEDTLLRLAMQIGAALDCAHQHDYVHGDVKPQNILISGKYPLTFKLGDFGIARRLGEHLPLPAGTPAFMAPEQKDLQKPPTPAADIHSFARVLCFAAMGKAPEAVLNNSLLATILQRLPESLRSPVQEALSESPAERPSASLFLHLRSRSGPAFTLPHISSPNLAKIEQLTAEYDSSSNPYLVHAPTRLTFRRTRILPGLWLPHRLPTFTDYLTFITDSANARWHPLRMENTAHDGGYLESWIDGGLPPRLQNYPASEIPHAAAEAFCEWLGARLPTSEELCQLLPKINETDCASSLDQARHALGYPLQFWCHTTQPKHRHPIARFFADSPFASTLMAATLPPCFCLPNLLCLPVISHSEASRRIDRAELSQAIESSLNDGQTVIG